MSQHGGEDGNYLSDICEFVASETDGMTGAGVISACNGAKLICAREAATSSETTLSQGHFLEYFESNRNGLRS